MPGLTRVLILGGGFAGLEAALELERRFAPGDGVQVTLVNRDNFFLFTPMLHEVAASDLDLATIVSPLRKLLRRATLFTGAVERIDLDARCVTVSHSEGHHHHELSYDHLVIALGSVTNFFDIPGLAARALTMKSLGDAIRLRNHLIALLEEADFECSADVRRPLLTVVVAGGGFAGVETVAALNDFLRESLAFYPNLRAEQLRIVLVHPGDVILPELGVQLGAYAQGRLAGRGVEILVQTRVSGVTNEGVTLGDGTCIAARTLVWTAGTSPNPIVDALRVEKSRGRIVVNDRLQVTSRPGVWALGDCAHIVDRATGAAYPPTAQHAIREGRRVGANIAAAIQGGAGEPFRFATIGLLASIGRRTGVANILGVNFSGFIAWWMWRTIYLSKLPRFEKKLRVALDWTLDLIFAKDLVQFGTVHGQTVSHPQEEEPPLATVEGAAPVPLTDVAA